MSKINKVVVKGVSYDIEDKNEVIRAKNAEEDIKKSAIKAEILDIESTEEEVLIHTTSIAGDSFEQSISPATSRFAGVMTAADKTKLDKAQLVESISWQGQDLNNYTTEGTYLLKGTRTNGDNVPIINEGTITARLSVLVTENGGNKVVTQVLTLNNNTGGEGNVYIRSQQAGTWKPWGKLQTNVEVGQITPDDMSNLTDNGIYSGVCVDGSTVETFVLIVINNYLAASQAGFGAYVSQLKYAINLNRGNTVKTRTRDAYGIWNEWSEVVDKYKLPVATATTLGGIKIGSGIEATTEGKINVALGANSGLTMNNKGHITLQLGTDRVWKNEEGLGGILPLVIGSSPSNAFKDAGVGVPLAEDSALEQTANGVKVKRETEVKSDSTNPVESQAIATAIGEGEKRALRRLFVAAGAEYNDTGADKTKTAPWGESITHKAGYYYLNGLGDITEEQMMDIYNAGKLRADISGFYAEQRRIRTNLPQTISGQNGYGGIKASGIFSGCENLEVAELTTQTVHISNGLGVALYGGTILYAFYNCKKLKYIQLLDAGLASSFASAFNGCKELAYVKIKGIKVNLGFPSSSLISKESVVFIIQNASPTSAITITLHPDAYARLAGDADIVAALEEQPLVTLVSL